MKNKIKIITGYSERGGSTTALINLTNFFNENGLDCTMYGPHDWHIGKCKSDNINKVSLDKSDRLIAHFLTLQKRPDVGKVLLSVHEKGWFPVGNIFCYWDEAIFLHEEHKKFHSAYTGKSRLIPNLKENLTSDNKKPNVENVCGIIGTIENRKQTHVSIQRALNDGCDKIIIYGKIGDESYFNTYVKPYLSDSRIELHGFTEKKQEMYDSIGRVYHSSLAEVACLVKDECYLTNTKFFGNSETEHEVSNLTNNEILQLWIETLNL